MEEGGRERYRLSTECTRSLAILISPPGIGSWVYGLGLVIRNRAFRLQAFQDFSPTLGFRASRIFCLRVEVG